MRLVAAALSVALFCCGLFVLAQAQEGFPIGRNPPSGLFTVTGALKGNGSGTISQAACGDLSNGGSGCSSAAAPCSAFGTAAGTCAQGGAITAGGPTGSATVVPIITYNAAGQLTTVTSATVTPAIGSVTGLGTGVATALGNSANAAGGLTTTPSCSWAPSDGSGAGLTFAGVSSACTRIGNMVFAYAKFTYPTTADSSHAIITGLPVTVPNAAYASQICTLSQGTGTYYQLQTIANTITAAFFSITGTNFANSGLSATQIDMMCVYPAS